MALNPKSYWVHSLSWIDRFLNKLLILTEYLEDELIPWL